MSANDLTSLSQWGRRTFRSVKRPGGAVLTIFLALALLLLIYFPLSTCGDWKWTNAPADAAVSAPISPEINAQALMRFPAEAEALVVPAAGDGTGSALIKPPVYFIPNLGRVDDSVHFYAAGAGYNFYVTPEGVTCAFTRRQGESENAGLESLPGAAEEVALEGYAIKIAFAGANSAAAIEGRRPNSATVSYFTGADETKWQTGVPTYAQVAYTDLYPGVDLTYQDVDGILKYEFTVAPQADPGQIRIVYQGADGLAVDEEGHLLITTPWGTLKDEKPFAYQLIGGRQARVSAAFAVDLDTVTFTLGSYDQSIPLVIDPGLLYATFLGGSGAEHAYSIAVDTAGFAYVTGYTESANFPVTAGAYDTGHNGAGDAFVAKLNPDGSGLVYATFLGGSSADAAYSIAVDAAGCAYVAGVTESANFPSTAGAYDTGHNGAGDAFVAKLNPDGSDLVYATFLGGSSADSAYSIAVDAAGYTYLTGYTNSSDLPATTGTYDTGHNGGADVFVAKLNPAGSDLVYATFLGGSDNDYGISISGDAAGCAYVTGYTFSSNFPATAGAHDTSFNGGQDVFVVKLNPAGSDLVYATFLGGSSLDFGQSIAVDAAGCAYVTGYTFSTDFPVMAGAHNTGHNGGADAFVAKLNPAGSALLYATFLGGSGTDVSQSIFVDASGCAYVTGNTESSDFPTTPGAYDTVHNGSADAFMAKLNPAGSALLYATFLGGSHIDAGISIAADAAGCAYVTGYTISSDFPATAGAYDTSHNGGPDVFVARLETPPSSPTLLSPADDSIAGGTSITFGWSAAAGATGYQLQVRKVSDDSVFIDAALGDVTSSEQSAFPNDGTAYRWRVRAVNNTGWGEWSDYRNLTNFGVPPAPTLLSPADDSIVGGTSITFGWSAVAGATGYQLQVRKVSDDSVFIDAVLGSVTSFKQSGFPNDGTHYRWRVRAGNDAGWGEWSDYRSLIGHTVPRQPLPLTGGAPFLLLPGLALLLTGALIILRWDNSATSCVCWLKKEGRLKKE